MMLLRTCPEPLCDVLAQVRALLDADHPKRAVFIAKGTELPETIPDSLIRIDLPEGSLLTVDIAKANRFSGDLTDDIMADLLDLPESKTTLTEHHFVVQAVDGAGCVITECATSAHRATETIERLRTHGIIRITDVLGALNRRLAHFS
jgi:hypothetical protein